MNGRATRCAIAIVALRCLLAGVGMGQEAPAAPATPIAPAKPVAPAASSPAQAHNNVRPAIKWKRSDYTCTCGAKVTVYVSGARAKVLFQEHMYYMKLTEFREGKRYSDGKVLWWEKENGAFLQEEAPGVDVKMMAKGCRVDKP